METKLSSSHAPCHVVRHNLLFVGMFISSIGKCAFFLLFTILNRTKPQIKKIRHIFVKSIPHFCNQISPNTHRNTCTQRKEKKELGLELAAFDSDSMVALGRI